VQTLSIGSAKFVVVTHETRRTKRKGGGAQKCRFKCLQKTGWAGEPQISLKPQPGGRVGAALRPTNEAAAWLPRRIDFLIVAAHTTRPGH
jgi:hypothetical protein